MTPYLGQVSLVAFNFAPVGWAICDGSLLSVPQNQALFTLLGTTYGGNGQSTFGLPDLRSRVAMHMGEGYVMGQLSGVENVTIDAETMPEHTHGLAVSADVGTEISPKSNYPATAPDGLGYVYGPYDADKASSMASGSISPTGGSEPHTNIQPYVTLNYIIALEGIFPSQN